MKLSKLFLSEHPTLSFEVFPPKSGSAFGSVEAAVKEIADLRPDFMSVTYGAGGSTGNYTVKIAEDIIKNYGVTALAHLTCVTASRRNINERLNSFKAAGIQNIMALRGDLPEGFTFADDGCYRHACELVEEIKRHGDFCVGGACYPEGHPESPDSDSDIKMLKLKVDAGCDFLTSQMFFDNQILYRFLYKTREAGIFVPIIAGIMPVTNAAQIKRITALSGTLLPQRFISIVDRFGRNPAAMKQAGIAYATEQIIDLLANGIKHIHIYTMNHPDVAKKICENLSAVMPAANAR